MGNLLMKLIVCEFTFIMNQEILYDENMKSADLDVDGQYCLCSVECRDS